MPLDLTQAVRSNAINFQPLILSKSDRDRLVLSEVLLKGQLTDKQMEFIRNMDPIHQQRFYEIARLTKILSIQKQEAEFVFSQVYNNSRLYEYYLGTLGDITTKFIEFRQLLSQVVSKRAILSNISDFTEIGLLEHVIELSKLLAQLIGLINYLSAQYNKPQTLISQLDAEFDSFSIDELTYFVLNTRFLKLKSFEETKQFLDYIISQSEYEFPNFVGIFILAGIDFSEIKMPFRQFPSQLMQHVFRRVNQKFQILDQPEQLNKLVLNYRNTINNYNHLIQQLEYDDLSLCVVSPFPPNKPVVYLKNQNYIQVVSKESVKSSITNQQQFYSAQYIDKQQRQQRLVDYKLLQSSTDSNQMLFQENRQKIEQRRESDNFHIIQAQKNKQEVQAVQIIQLLERKQISRNEVSFLSRSFGLSYQKVIQKQKDPQLFESMKYQTTNSKCKSARSAVTPKYFNKSYVKTPRLGDPLPSYGETNYSQESQESFREIQARQKQQGQKQNRGSNRESQVRLAALPPQASVRQIQKAELNSQPLQRTNSSKEHLIQPVKQTEPSEQKPVKVARKLSSKQPSQKVLKSEKLGERESSESDHFSEQNSKKPANQQAEVPPVKQEKQEKVDAEQGKNNQHDDQVRKADYQVTAESQFSQERPKIFENAQQLNAAEVQPEMIKEPSDEFDQSSPTRNSPVLKQAESDQYVVSKNCKVGSCADFDGASPEVQRVAAPRNDEFDEQEAKQIVAENINASKEETDEFDASPVCQQSPQRQKEVEIAIKAPVVTNQNAFSDQSPAKNLQEQQREPVVRPEAVEEDEFDEQSPNVKPLDDLERQNQQSPAKPYLNEVRNNQISVEAVQYKFDLGNEMSANLKQVKVEAEEDFD